MNTEQFWSALRALVAAGGPVAVLLIALGFPAVQVGIWSGAALAAIGAAAVIWPLVSGFLSHTDAAKLAAVSAMPDVTTITVKPTATDGVGAALADPEQPKVVLDATSTAKVKT